MNPQDHAPTPILNKICVKANKQPVSPWKEYQSRLITAEEFELQERNPSKGGIAIVCGEVSGGLKVIDIDTKNDPNKNIHEQLIDAISDELRQCLYIVETVNGGRHIYYRSDTPRNKTILAKRRMPDAVPSNKNTLIELAAQGSYVVAPPTPGYRVVQGSEDAIPTLTEEEEETLLRICRSFNELEQIRNPLEPLYPSEQKYNAQSVFEAYNAQNGKLQVLELLVKAGWAICYTKGERTYMRRPGKKEGISADYNERLNLFKVFTTSSEFDPDRAYSPCAVLNLIRFRGDWKATASYLREQGFGSVLSGEIFKAVNRTRELISKNLPQSKIASFLQSEGYADNELDANAIIEQTQKIRENEQGAFWSFSKKGAVSIDFKRLYELLHDWGYRKLKGASGVFVRVQGKIVFEVRADDEIKASIFGFLEEVSAPAEVDNQLRKQIATILSDAHLNSNLESVEIEILRDDKAVKYMTFRNGIAQITNEGEISMIPYEEATGYFWAHDIKDIDFVPDENIMFSLGDCEFYRFLKCISDEEGNMSDTPRTEYAMMVFGYMIHTYKDPSRPWIVFLLESFADDENGGGTGKGLFVQAVGYAVGHIIIPGRDFNPENRFTYSRVAQNTMVVVIDDAKKGLRLDVLYTAATEGLRIEKKGKDEVFLDYQRSPKFIVTTNFSLDLTAVHTSRRVRQLEFGDFFGKHRTPQDYFGHLLFGDWDEAQWNLYYNFCLYAAWMYMGSLCGLEERQPSAGAEIKELKRQFGREFVDWFTEFMQEVDDEYTCSKKQLYHQFIQETGYPEKEYTQIKFFKGIPKACAVFKIDCSLTRPASGGRERSFRFRKTQGGD